MQVFRHRIAIKNDFHPAECNNRPRCLPTSSRIFKPRDHGTASFRWVYWSAPGFKWRRDGSLDVSHPNQPIELQSDAQLMNLYGN